MVRFMRRALLLGLILSISAVSAQASTVATAAGAAGAAESARPQGSMMRGAGVAAAGAGAYNQQTAVARSINANTAMQVNQYMYEVNKNNAKYFYTRSANKQKEESSTGEAIYKRLHDNPSGHDIHTGDALNVVLDELTNPDVYTAGDRRGDPAHRQPARQEHRVRVRRQHDRDQPGRPQRCDADERLRPDYATTPTSRARSRLWLPRSAGDRGQGQVSAETLANCRVAIKALKDKVDSLLPQGAPNRLEADNYLKALFGLSKMLETPSVDQYLTGLNKVDSTTLGHLIAFMHTFNLRFGAAKTPVQEETYDQLYPLLVAVRDQAKVPSANPYTTSSGPQDPKAFSAYFSQMQYDPKHGVVPPPPPPPGQP